MTALRRNATIRLDGWRYAAALFFVFVVLAFVNGRLSLDFIAFVDQPQDYPVPDILAGFARWDTGWYRSIADSGYFYNGPAQQSSVAFFPAYPFAMRLLAYVVGNLIVAGVVITLVSGVTVAVLFHRWVSAFLGPRTAKYALALFLCYPFAFYLFGAVYSDALFIAAVLGAFTLLERDRPVLAGMVGIIATAARPVGIALVIGLAIRVLEIRGVLPGSRPAAFVPRPTSIASEQGSRVPLLPRRVRLANVRVRDAGVLLSGFGLVAFAALLWYRFGDPLAFTRVSSAPGWYKDFNLETFLKLHLFRLLGSYGLGVVTFWLSTQGLFAVLALALVPATIRRFGWGYGAYLFVAIGIAFTSTREFLGMGRYVLAGFPAFAAAADLVLGWSRQDRSLARLRGALPTVVLTTSALGLAWMVSLYARWYLLS